MGLPPPPRVRDDPVVRRLALVLALGSLLAGCGAGGGAADDGEDGVRAAIAAYGEAAEARDAKALCGLYTRGTRDGFASFGGTCEEVLATFLEEGEGAPAIEVRRVDVLGDTATAEVVEDGERRTQELRREGGAWKLVDEAFAPAAPVPAGAPPDPAAARRPGEAGVRGAVELHDAGQRRGDASATCTSLTSAARKRVASRFGTCERAYAERFAAPGFEPVALETRAVRLRGTDRAIATVAVTFQGESLDETYRLRREDGAWRIDLDAGG